MGSDVPLAATIDLLRHGMRPSSHFHFHLKPLLLVQTYQYLS